MAMKNFVFTNGSVELYANRMCRDSTPMYVHHRLQPSRNLRDSPGNLGFVPSPRAYLTVQCTCPGRRKTSHFILVIIVYFTSMCDDLCLNYSILQWLVAFLGVVINRCSQFMGVVNVFRVWLLVGVVSSLMVISRSWSRWYTHMRRAYFPNIWYYESRLTG